MTEKKELTKMQEAFLEALCGSARGNIREAMDIAGYSTNTRINEVVGPLRDEIVDRASMVLDEKKAGWVPQLDDLQSMLTIEENIAHHILRMDAPEREARVEELMRSMNLTSFSGQITRTLSGGQRQRVIIAKAMAGDPPVLLMDESLAQLDLRTKSAILLDMKAMIKRSKSAALLVLHDPADALLVADTLWVIRGGKLVQSGTPNAIIADPAHHEIAGLFDYINVVPAELNVPGPWREEKDVKWLYAHDLPALDAEILDRMETPSGPILVYQFQNHRLLKK